SSIKGQIVRALFHIIAVGQKFNIIFRIYLAYLQIGFFAKMQISELFLHQIIHHAKIKYPNEACGILAGIDNCVLKVYQMTNVNDSPDSYFMNPQEQLRVMKDIRQLDYEFMGIYHSHPNTDAYPSQRDVDMAYYPEAVYVIISLKDWEKPDVKAFRIIDGKVKEGSLTQPPKEERVNAVTK
ncbi:MAG: Mov34/MPN/PAD-1 family protein, partial [Candidatus Poribacteria bacterium]